MKKRIFALVLALLCLASLPACQKDNGDGPGTEAPAVTDAPAFKFMENGVSDLTFVYTSSVLGDVGKAISGMYTPLKSEYPDSGLKLKSDRIDPAEKEIIIGKTTREGQAEFYKEIPDFCYVIDVSEDKIRIGADTSELLIEAVEYFNEAYLQIGEGGNLSIPVGRFVSEPQKKKIELNRKDTFVTKTTKVKKLETVDGKRTMQGGCTDGEYLYMAMINPGHSSGQQELAYIHKIDLETMETVKISKAIPSDHSNDLTYIPETNELYVNHCYEYGKRCTIVDADTLEMKGTREFPDNHNSISYSVEKDVFVIATRTMFRVIDRKTFRVPAGFQQKYNPVPVEYTSQGSCVDEDYIYFVFFRDNCIMVYDWSGEFVTSVEIDIGSPEPENLSIVGDTIYIGCNEGGGGTLYMGKIVKK